MLLALSLLYYISSLAACGCSRRDHTPAGPQHETCTASAKDTLNVAVSLTAVARPPRHEGDGGFLNVQRTYMDRCTTTNPTGRVFWILGTGLDRISDIDTRCTFGKV
jgi:hypothetical protein